MRKGTRIDRGRGSHVRCNAGAVESAVREAENFDEALPVAGEGLRRARD